jgi:hypothetical protein
MILELNAAVQSLLGLSKIMQAGYEVRNANEINSAIAETLSKLVTAQSGVLAIQEKQALLQEEKATLTEHIRELEQKIMALENWEREKERYSLTDITPGIPARILKPGMENGESTHPLCATCFENRKKSFLQYGSHLASKRMACAECEGEWFPTNTSHPPRKYPTPEPIEDENGKIRY